MIFSGIKGITIPEGVVQQIADGAGSILWKGGVDVASMAISYTGAYTDQLDVVMSGKTYRLLTLTGSGTLTVPEEVTADVWMVGGGSGGHRGYSGNGGIGGGGGMSLFESGITISDAVAVTIGAGGSGSSTSSLPAIGGASSFGDLSTPVPTNFRNGGSGGGCGGGLSSNYIGNGDGLSKWPFEVENLTGMHLHSGGGGGGGYYQSSTIKYNGGNGGSNGSNGTESVKSTTYLGGAGGEYGGGNGGRHTSGDNNYGVSATYYGGGGGGGTKPSGSTQYAGRAGYQGVVYVRIPYEQ